MYIFGWRCRAPIEGGEYRPIYIGNRSEVFRTTFANLSTFSRAVKKQMLELLKKHIKNILMD